MSKKPYTHFDLTVWTAALEVPSGRMTTYAGLAKAIGRPRAARAVANALGRNPLPVIVPCHRIVRSDGQIGGYSGGGPGVKRALLAKEGIKVGKDGRIPDKTDLYI